MNVAEAVGRQLGRRPELVEPLTGGCVGEVWLLHFPDGERLVAKVEEIGAGALELEGYMLRYLAERSRLPVPRVHHAGPGLLVMQHLAGSTGAGGFAEEHAAELLAELHEIRAEAFGHERDTLIGGLPQANPWTASWLEFFARHRLLAMGRQALDAGRLDSRTFADLERAAGRLDRWLTEPPRPSLLHGDVWSGNVLSRGGRITGFLDPAIYHGHPEVELAFTTLFATFGDRFFAAYRERRPLEAEFFSLRRHVYNLYPLLVHVRLFGGGYLGQVRSVLKRLLG